MFEDSENPKQPKPSPISAGHLYTENLTTPHIPNTASKSSSASFGLSSTGKLVPIPNPIPTRLTFIANFNFWQPDHLANLTTVLMFEINRLPTITKSMTFLFPIVALIILTYSCYKPSNSNNVNRPK